MAAALVLVPSPARAQDLYLARAPEPGAAPTYTGWSAISFTDRTGVVDADDGIATLPLPFAFTFFGKGYSSVDVGVNGVLYLENGAPKTCPGGFSVPCNFPHSFPDPLAPNALIGFWWGDMDLSAGSATYTTHGVSPDRVFAIRFQSWGAYNSSGIGGPRGLRDVQVDLHEADGAIRIYYGQLNASAIDEDRASAGVEDGSGTLGVGALPCSNDIVRCSQVHWPAGQVVGIGPSALPDLVPASLEISALRPVSVGGQAGFEVDVTTVLRNRGLQAAVGFSYDLYLSLDGSLDAGDVRLLTHSPLETVPGGSQARFSELNVRFARPAGDFHLVVVADPPSVAQPRGAVEEALEDNNILFSPVFLLGAELGGAVEAPAATGPGEIADFRVLIRNSGTDPAGPFSYELWASANPTVGAEPVGTRFHSGTVSLAGGESFDKRVSVAFPQVPVGDHYVFLNIDPRTALLPQGEVEEVVEANNLVRSGKVTVATADLAVEAVRFKSAESPFQDSDRGYFGETARVAFTVRNQGAGTARNFDTALFLSDNASITLFDQDITPAAPELRGMTLLPGASVTLDVELTVPLLGTTGAGLSAGDYFIGVIADVTSRVSEANKANNAVPSARTVWLRPPAIDLAPVRVDAPAVAALGEVMPVSRVIRNIGSRGNDLVGPAFSYRFVLTPNELVTLQDIPLRLVTAAGDRDAGSGRLAAGAEDRGTDLLRLPSDLSPGTYFVGLIVDSDNVLAELDETNNTALSLGSVEVLPSSLQIETGFLPDALLGAPYLHGLVASGGDGSYLWALDAEQGAPPSGIRLTADGTLSGTVAPEPGSEGVAVFTATVASNGHLARRRLALRLVKTVGALEVSTAWLPAAVKGRTLEVPLAAVGGVRPYRWELAEGSLPAGLILSSDGTLRGEPEKAYREPVSFKVQVTDANGQSASAELMLRVVENGRLVISLPSLADAVVAEAFTIPLMHLGGTAPFQWQVTRGELPEGLTIAGARMSGRPRKPGLFPFSLEVRDAEGLHDTGNFVLTVLPRSASFLAPRSIPQAIPGELFVLDLAAQVQPGAMLTVFGGALPPGLQLNRGAIEGTVASDAAFRAYDFVLEIIEPSGARALAPLTITVAPSPPVWAGRGATGCSVGGGGVFPNAVGLLALWPLLRRRRPGGTNEFCNELGGRE